MRLLKQRTFASAAFLFALSMAAGVHAQSPGQLDIREYYISGNTVLNPEVMAQACAPFLGPGRTAEDVDKARAALEAAYRRQGYKTVGVSIPQQTVKDGVVHLEIVENRVGHLNVVGSKYHSLERIRQQVPSLAEGSVPDFGAVERDLVAVNQQADRRIAPALKAGVAPGTVDVDLVVDDNLPLHGSLEVNNRRSQDTSALRALASLRYENLWQRGHSLSIASQVAPQNIDDAMVVYGSYVARFANSPFSLQLNALRSDSDVSTVGGTNVVGKGSVVGVRGVWVLPGDEHLYGSMSFGVDYKRFRNEVSLEDGSISTPITYYPFALGYTGLLRHARSTTQLEIGARFAFSGLGSDAEVFGLNRVSARGQQLSVRASVDHTRNLLANWQARVRLSGQLSDQPLISNEQFSVGGFDSVRGYLESEALGDSGWDGSFELRTPTLLPALQFVDELRLFGFVDRAHVRLRATLPEQIGVYSLMSAGAGLDMHLWHHLNGSLIWASPLETGPLSESGDSRWLFRMWADF